MVVFDAVDQTESVITLTLSHDALYEPVVSTSSLVFVALSCSIGGVVAAYCAMKQNTRCILGRSSSSSVFANIDFGLGNKRLLI